MVWKQRAASDSALETLSTGLICLGVIIRLLLLTLWQSLSLRPIAGISLCSGHSPLWPGPGESGATLYTRPATELLSHTQNRVQAISGQDHFFKIKLNLDGVESHMY